MNRSMNLEDFIQAYEQALGTQEWSQVEPLVHQDACVTFSNGAVHKGKDEVGKAFTRNFSTIKDETYSISNVHWVRKDDNTAVYLFDFHWTGIINEKQTSGSGRGTCVLIKDDEQWKLLIEHLGPKPA